jgi:hypothetical protein
VSDNMDAHEYTREDAIALIQSSPVWVMCDEAVAWLIDYANKLYNHIGDWDKVREAIELEHKALIGGARCKGITLALFESEEFRPLSLAMARTRQFANPKVGILFPPSRDLTKSLIQVEHLCMPNGKLEEDDDWQDGTPIPWNDPNIDPVEDIRKVAAEHDPSLIMLLPPHLRSPNP